MSESPVTYQNLFALLVSLGFQQQPATPATKRHIFLHEPTDSILAFGRKPNESVTPADLLSTEIHLHGRGIADEALESLLRGMSAAK